MGRNRSPQPEHRAPIVPPASWGRQGRMADGGVWGDEVIDVDAIGSSTPESATPPVALKDAITVTYEYIQILFAKADRDTFIDWTDGVQQYDVPGLGLIVKVDTPWTFRPPAPTGEPWRFVGMHGTKVNNARSILADGAVKALSWRPEAELGIIFVAAAIMPLTPDCKVRLLKKTDATSFGSDGIICCLEAATSEAHKPMYGDHDAIAELTNTGLVVHCKSNGHWAFPETCCWMTSMYFIVGKFARSAVPARLSFADI